MLLLALVSCDDAPPGKPTADETCDPAAVAAAAPALVPGAPMAGAAEAILDAPIGTPLSGYTSRCDCFGGAGNVDRRDSQYVFSFAPSVGVQAPSMVKVVWLANGDQDLVLVKLDLIYPFDGLVEQVEADLGAALGMDLDGKVVLSSNHSHSAPGDFTDSVTFYLGSDRFNYEVFLRMADRITSTALAAHDTLQPAKLGMGIAKDWDPDDRVYSDRRGENDTLQFFDDIPAGRYKDPYLTMFRVDSVDDEPIAVLFHFGIHGTILDDDNALASSEAPGHLELVLQERFDTPVVTMHLQGAGGDASPGGADGGLARLESVGELGADAIYALWDAIPTASDPISLETTGRSVDETHQALHVTRGGTVDLRYVPYDEDLEPDNLVYAEDGSLLSPIDEFNALYGAVFCGETYLEGLGPSTHPAYTNCVEVDRMAGIVDSFFELSDEEVALPFADTTKATVAATRFGPIPILEADGTVTTDSVFMGFFPGETTSMLVEQFRRLSASHLGWGHAVAVGYSQEEEGYLNVAEDWLLGGYEASINVWGPLQGEHILEQIVGMGEEVLATDVAEPAHPCGLYEPPDWGEWTLPTATPDVTPEAGTLLTEPPDYLYSPLYTADELDAGVQPDLVVPATVARVQGIVAMAWIGGDPAVDYPEVVLQRQGDDGSWAEVLTTSGRPVRLGPDILLTHTPDPLAPPELEQVHTWYAAWQAVGHVTDRAGLPVGTYRLHVTGRSWTGAEATWPWTSEEYTVDSDPFEVVPAAITVTASGNDIVASLVGPARGWRLVGLDGDHRGNNPLPDDLGTLILTHSDGSQEILWLEGARGGGVTTFAGVLSDDVVSVQVQDTYGNEGSLER